MKQAKASTNALTYRIHDGKVYAIFDPEQTCRFLGVSMARDAEAMEFMRETGCYVSRFEKSNNWRVRLPGGFDPDLAFSCGTDHYGNFPDPTEALLTYKAWLRSTITPAATAGEGET